MPEPLKSAEQRSAALHDFCLVIPYGLVLLLCGAVSLLVGSGWSGARTLAAGCLSLGLANASLQIWRTGQKNILITVLEAGTLTSYQERRICASFDALLDNPCSRLLVRACMGG